MPEVDVVPQTVVVDFKQSVLIGYVSARTKKKTTGNGDDDNNSERDPETKSRIKDAV